MPFRDMRGLSLGNLCSKAQESRGFTKITKQAPYNMWNKTITHSNELSGKGREIYQPQDCQKLVTDEGDCGATYGYAHAATVQLTHWVWNHLAETLFPKVTVLSVSPTKRKSPGS